MSRKPVPAQVGDRSRLELTFDKPQLLSVLFGQYDQNLVALENRLDVFITARGNRVGLEGPAEQVALARDVLNDLYKRIQRGEEADAGLVDAAIAMASEPELDGIVRAEAGDRAPQIMIRTRKKTIVPRTPMQAVYMRELVTNDMIFALGPAGTGKTYLAMAAAVSALLKNQVERIILTRPAVEAGEALGFLPGDLREKILPYLRPLYDALHDMLDPEDITRLSEKGVIEIAPLAYMRGRTLSHAFVVLDEAQNTTPEQMMMFLTRLGEESRMVVTGDVTQIDLPRSKQSGLLEVRHILRDIPGIDFHTFSGSDVVRHPLVQRIIEAYDAYRNPMTGTNGEGEKR
jgi:phosphate starvation-inducible PhoH-like protein